MAKVSMKPQMSAVHMEISQVSKLTTVFSPKVYIYGIPWKVEASKNEDENSLAIYLHCDKKDKSSNWVVSAGATIKLLAFSKNKSALVEHISPNVFDSSNCCFGTNELIEWPELMSRENKYVKNDTIQLKIEITAEDPNYADRAILKFEPIDKCCDHGSHATFRLTVKNIENLLAVRSPEFTVRGLPWDLTVFKNPKSYLGIKLSNKYSEDEEVSCEIEMSIKLCSFNDSFGSKSGELANSEYLRISKICPWDEMLKYVNRNSFILEVKLTAEKPDGDIADADPNPSGAATKRRRLECSICYDDLDNEDISTTIPCGHLFCTPCINEATKIRKVCPMCKATVKKLQRVYLPVSK